MKPTHRLKVFNKKTEANNPDLGAGWLNPDGRITIVLNPCVVLTQSEDLVFTLFPIDRPKEEKKE